MKRILLLLAVSSLFACTNNSPEGDTQEISDQVITSDIDNFWAAYDLIIQETDSLEQAHLLDSIYIQNGSEGLQKIMEVRQYTIDDYIQLIKRYPKFFNSIRSNTLTSKTLATELNEGVEKLRSIYPHLKPAKIYFTIGAMRTNGTTRDSLVLIGSELAMADPTTDISEFEGGMKKWLENYFGTNPLEGLVLLNVHEYVHTQQTPIPENLLHMVLYEGIAEFVSVTAMGVPSDSPAIEFGKTHPEVKQKFEEEMFYERIYEWLWSNEPNEFNMRDLGYYIGYAIAEQHYQKSSDKQQAIAELIELDYSKPTDVNNFIDETGFFSKPIETLYENDKQNRPSVEKIKQFQNGTETLASTTKEITFQFSEPLDVNYVDLRYSELMEAGFPTIIDASWAEDSLSWTLNVDLEANKHYKFLLTGYFRGTDGTALMPYTIDFKTSN